MTNALGMAIDSRRPPQGTIIHSDLGTQCGSRAITGRAKDSRAGPVNGAFWSRMQVELLDRRRWRTRIEFANAIFEYLQIWHNRRRRHSAGLGSHR